MTNRVPPGGLPRRLIWLGLTAVGGAVAEAPAVAQLPDPKPLKAEGDPKKPDDKKEEPNGNGKRPEEPVYSNPVSPAAARLGLGECIAIGVEKQPSMRAALHSLRATELGLQSLNNIHNITTLFSPDIPVRRQQAVRGITVAQAEVNKVRDEITYDVTRLYFTYVYARQQEQTANDAIENLDVFRKVIEDILKAGVVDPKVRVNQFTLYAIRDVIAEVRKQRVAAVAGQKAALAALKEVMGVDDGFDFVPRETELPVMAGLVTKDAVVEQALARRPELAQAAAGVDAFRLEVCAQAEKRTARQVPTLASGSDLHARPVPLPLRNGEYRPGAIAPEMPPNLVGKVEDRVARANEYSLRAEAVYDKAVGLVRLEATNSYLNWEAASERLRQAKQRLDNAREALEKAREATQVRQDPELLVRSEAVASKAQGEYVEAVFEHIKSLATLERVTAGGLRAGFPGR